MNSLAHWFLRRPPFRGQQRLKTLFERLNWLDFPGPQAVSPLLGDFVYMADPKQHIDSQILICGDYEYPTKRLFAEHIRSGDVVLDVGANTGFHTMFFSTLVGPTGQVYAFEPVERTRERCLANLALNGIQNTTVLPFALGTEAKTLWVHADAASGNIGAYNLFDQSRADVEVHVRKCDDVVRELGLSRLDFVKMDVEGYEALVWQGLKDTLHRFRPVVCLEFDSNYQPKSGISNEAFLSSIESCGYRLFEPSGKSLRPFHFDPKRLYSLNLFALPTVV